MHKSKRAEHALCVAMKDIEIVTAVRNSKNVRACIFQSLFLFVLRSSCLPGLLS